MQQLLLRHNPMATAGRWAETAVYVRVSSGGADGHAGRKLIVGEGGVAVRSRPTDS